MEKLLITLAEGLVENKDEIRVTATKQEDTTVFHLNVAADDMGRVIGKHGKIAKAIRTIVRAAATGANQRVSVEID